MNLSFAFFDWNLHLRLHPQGVLLFRPARRWCAMVGGIALGTVDRADAAVGQEMAGAAGGDLREHAALDPAGDGDPVVLPADSRC